MQGATAQVAHAADQHQIESLSTKDGSLQLVWGDKHRSAFHYVWLLDNCFCSDCGAEYTEKRVLRLLDMPLTVAPATVDLREGKVQINWSNGHTSVYDPAWLRAHCYSSRERLRRKQRPSTWGNELASRLPEAAYQKAAANSSVQLEMLQRIRDFGFVIIRGVPTRKDEILRVAELAGPVRESYYGRIFDIINIPDPKASVLSSTALRILPHTDEGWRSVPVGIIFFHCLEASSGGGGESVLIDGFRISEVLRDTDPDAFRLLSSTPWQFSRHNEGAYDLYSEGRLICVDKDDTVVGFRYSFRFRAPLDIPPDLVEDFYSATKKLMALIYDPKYQIHFRLEPGDILAFDNHRLIHGRTAFSNRRHFRYCHVDRDDFHSRLRLLGRQHGARDRDLVMPRGALV